MAFSSGLLAFSGHKFLKAVMLKDKVHRTRQPFPIASGWWTEKPTVLPFVIISSRSGLNYQPACKSQWLIHLKRRRKLWPMSSSNRMRKVCAYGGASKINQPLSSFYLKQQNPRGLGERQWPKLTQSTAISVPWVYWKHEIHFMIYLLTLLSFYLC